MFAVGNVRCNLERMIHQLGERSLLTKFGTFREFTYYDGKKETYAIVMGEIAGGDGVLCRIHTQCVGAHFFNSVECECREEMERSQALIEREGRGIVIFLDQEAKGNGHLALVESTKFKLQGIPQGEAYEMAGFARDARDYRPAAAIIKDLGIRSIVLLTGAGSKADELRSLGINVISTQGLGDLTS